jgi:hypothetical protein
MGNLAIKNSFTPFHTFAFMEFRIELCESYVGVDDDEFPQFQSGYMRSRGTMPFILLVALSR